MSADSDPVDLPLAQRVTLLGLAHLSRTGGLPAHTGEVIRACSGRLEAVEDAALGRLGEAEVSRALNALEAAGYVEMAKTGETSPTGKGRPAYSLAVETDPVLEAFRDDDRMEALLEAFAQAWN